MGVGPPCSFDSLPPSLPPSLLGLLVQVGDDLEVPGGPCRVVGLHEGVGGGAPPAVGGREGGEGCGRGGGREAGRM